MRSTLKVASAVACVMYYGSVDTVEAANKPVDVVTDSVEVYMFKDMLSMLFSTMDNIVTTISLRAAPLDAKNDSSGYLTDDLVMLKKLCTEMEKCKSEANTETQKFAKAARKVTDCIDGINKKVATKKK